MLCLPPKSSKSQKCSSCGRRLSPMLLQQACSHPLTNRIARKLSWIWRHDPNAGLEGVAELAEGSKASPRRRRSRRRSGCGGPSRRRPSRRAPTCRRRRLTPSAAAAAAAAARAALAATRSAAGPGGQQRRQTRGSGTAVPQPAPRIGGRSMSRAAAPRAPALQQLVGKRPTASAQANSPSTAAGGSQAAGPDSECPSAQRRDRGHVESPKAAKLPRVESAAEYVLEHGVEVGSEPGLLIIALMWDWGQPLGM